MTNHVSTEDRDKQNCKYILKKAQKQVLFHSTISQLLSLSLSLSLSVSLASYLTFQTNNNLETQNSMMHFMGIQCLYVQLATQLAI